MLHKCYVVSLKHVSLQIQMKQDAHAHISVTISDVRIIEDEIALVS